ncbi:MAG: hypothetical protein AUJ12_04585 [Alphaproteobacteria bacterium CG1_02_46_17]|nr:MAG: hypothetical protein AUJ12_04585 [Alphaproteobacteria bacterium CG1_02_46_17]
MPCFVLSMCMASRNKFLCFFVLQLMLLAQLVLAHHSTVHFLEDGVSSVLSGTVAGNGMGIDDDRHDSGDTPSRHKICDTCLLAKNFSQMVFADPVIVLQNILTDCVHYSDARQIFVQQVSFFYQSRAPPIRLV